MSSENGPQINLSEVVKPNDDLSYKGIEFYMTGWIQEEQKDQIKVDQKKLIDSGVCDALLQLRDSGEIKGSQNPLYEERELPQTTVDKIFSRHRTVKEKISDYTPAQIMWERTSKYAGGDDKTRVTMTFDGNWGIGGSSSGMFADGVYLSKKITAEVDDKGSLLINHHEVKNNLLDAIRQEAKAIELVQS